jgi:hypothetical protein
MAYCPNCAAVLDPRQKFCSRCGQPSGVESGVAPIPAPLAVAEKSPPGVQIAIALLLITCAISLVSIANLFLIRRAVASPVFLTRSVGLTILMILLVIGLWQRQGWARIAILVLIVWGIGNLAFSMIRVAASNVAVWTFAIPLAIAALRLCAVYLMFRPESNAWFKK